MIESRCTGHCCRDFYLPKSPEELKEALEKYERNEYSLQDIEIIQPMVIHLRYIEETKEHRYTCKNLAANGDCAIYEKRPRMCSEYPYNKPCPFPGCTYVAPLPVFKPPMLLVLDDEPIKAKET